MKPKAFPKRIYVVWEKCTGDPAILISHESADELNIGDIAGVYELKERVRCVASLELVK